MGPLKGFRIIELAGIGPGPFAGMLFSDMGAEVIRIERGSNPVPNPADINGRGRRSMALNLKDPAAVEIVLKLVETADAIFEGYRPGIAEKLGVGPEQCLARNPKIVYGRMTGWGQSGPLAHAAGHDINYISITGALHAIGRKDSGPVPPLNLVGDFGGGALYLAMGMLAALLEAQKSGKGQVVDAAITDGTISLMTFMQSSKASNMWTNDRQDNLLDGGAHYYDTYECADGKWVSIGSIEPQFYALLAQKLEIDIGGIGFEAQFDKSKWPLYKERISARIKTKTAKEWCDLMEGTDVCFAPVLDLDEAPKHPHNVARQAFVELEGVVQSAPAPRFSRTPTSVQFAPVAAGSDTGTVLTELGFGESDIAALRAKGALT
jgi:alpha-methylacyl-CoA racemase